MRERDKFWIANRKKILTKDEQERRRKGVYGLVVRSDELVGTKGKLNITATISKASKHPDPRKFPRS